MYCKGFAETCSEGPAVTVLWDWHDLHVHPERISVSSSYCRQSS